MNGLKADQKNVSKFFKVKDGWTKCVLGAPVLHLDTVEKYLLESKAFDGCKRLCIRQADKGFKFFTEGFINDVLYNAMPAEPAVIFKCFCWASMKAMKYRVFVALNRHDSEVVEAYCECTAGLGEACNHIAGLLYWIAEFMNKENNSPTSTATETTKLSCTDVLCKWIDPNGPSKKPVQPKPLSEINFQRRIPGKVLKSPSKRAKFIPTEIADESSRNRTGALEVLHRKISDNGSDILWTRYGFPNTKTTPSEEVPYLQEINTVNLTVPDVNLIEDHEDLWSIECQKLYSTHKSLQPISAEVRTEILLRTIGQAENPNWFSERENRLTASNFARAISCGAPDGFLKSILYPKIYQRTPAALEYGRVNENIAVEKYQEFMLLYDKEVFIFETGLFVSSAYPYLAASPDRIVRDTSCKEIGIIEVKCPYKFREKTVEEACEHKTFCCELVSNEIRLKRTHPYFKQIQGQMAIAASKWCDFVIWTNHKELSSAISVERIPFDARFWASEMLPALEHFYLRALLPELMTRRIKRRGFLYPPDKGYVAFKKIKKISSRENIQE